MWLFHERLFDIWKPKILACSIYFQSWSLTLLGWMNVISSFVHLVSFSWNSSAATCFANSSTVCWTLLSSKFVTVSEIVESPSYFHKSVPGMLRSQWDPSWKRSPTPGKSQLPGESTYDLGPVQTHPFLFENENIFLLFGLPTTRIRWKRSVQTHLSRNAIQSRYFWKHRLLVYVDGRKQGLSNTAFLLAFTHAL